MPQLIQSLSEIAGDYDLLFCDLWGCVHDGVNVFPDAAAALQAFRKGGGQVAFLTNAPRPYPGITAQLDKLGCPKDAWDAVVTSGDATRIAVGRQLDGLTIFHIGPKHDATFFDDAVDDIPSPNVTRGDLKDADAVICTGLVDDTTETADEYRAWLLEAKTRGLTLYCANPDIVVDRGDQRVYCAGALAALYQEMGGEAVYFGKPHPPIYDLARRKLSRNASADRTLAIGDGVTTDIAGAMGEGVDALFVAGGIAADRLMSGGEPDADRINGLLRDHQTDARYAIGHLR